MQVIVVHHEDDAGLLALDEAACEAVGNASARGPSAGIQVMTRSPYSALFALVIAAVPTQPFPPAMASSYVNVAIAWQPSHVPGKPYPFKGVCHDLDMSHSKLFMQTWHAHFK